MNGVLFIACLLAAAGGESEEASEARREKPASSGQGGDESGWIEAPTPEAPAVPQTQRELVADTPRGWLVGARFDSDWALPSRDIGMAPALDAGFAGRDFGINGTLLVTWPVGVRAEGRIFLFSRGPLRPFAGLGLSLFYPAVGARAVAGVLWKVWGPVVLGVDVAAETFWGNPIEFRDNMLLVGASAAYNL